MNRAYPVPAPFAERQHLDLTRPFLPDSLARVRALHFLTPGEAVILNQIRGYGYLHLLGVVEEHILPQILDRAWLPSAGPDGGLAPLIRRFRTAFEGAFHARCDVVDPGESLCQTLLAHHPLSLGLVLLHIEWMAQHHCVESIARDENLNPAFRSLLQHHWLREARHANPDARALTALAARVGPAAVQEAVQGYLSIAALTDEVLAAQVRLDLATFIRATARRMSAAERALFTSVQHQACRWTFIGSGMTHPKFVGTLAHLSAEARDAVARAAALFL